MRDDQRQHATFQSNIHQTDLSPSIYPPAKEHGAIGEKRGDSDRDKEREKAANGNRRRKEMSRRVAAEFEVAQQSLVGDNSPLDAHRVRMSFSHRY